MYAFFDLGLFYLHCQTRSMLNSDNEGFLFVLFVGPPPPPRAGGGGGGAGEGGWVDQRWAGGGFLCRLS